MKSQLLQSAIWVAITLAMVAYYPSQAQESSGSEIADKAVRDAKIAAALQRVSAARIQVNIEKLVSFGTRSTLSAQEFNNLMNLQQQQDAAFNAALAKFAGGLAGGFGRTSTSEAA